MDRKGINLSLGKTYVGSIVKQVAKSIFIVKINGLQLTSYSDIKFYPNEKIFVSVIKKEPKYTLKLLKSFLFNSTEEMSEFISFCEKINSTASIFNQWLWINFLKDTENKLDFLSKESLKKITLLSKVIPETHNIPFGIYLNLLNSDSVLFDKILESQFDIFQNLRKDILPDIYQKILDLIKSNSFQMNKSIGKINQITYKYFFIEHKNITFFIPIKFFENNEDKIYSVQIFHWISENAKMLTEIKFMNMKYFVYLENEDILLNMTYKKITEILENYHFGKTVITQKPILTLYEKIKREII